MQPNGRLLAVRNSPRRTATVVVAGLFLSTTLVNVTPVQAQNWRGVGAGIAAGIIGAAIVGGAMSQQQRGYAVPGGHRSATHRHRGHKDDEETTPASAKSEEGTSLAGSVVTTSSEPASHTTNAASGNGPAAEDVGLMRDKAR